MAYKSRLQGRKSWPFLWCSDKRLLLFLRSFKAQKYFVKTITGVYYFRTGCLDDSSSLVTVVLKMWLYPLAFTLRSTYVHSGSLQGMLLKVWQGLKILGPQSQIWQLFMKLPTCTFSKEKFNTENEGHHSKVYSESKWWCLLVENNITCQCMTNSRGTDKGLKYTFGKTDKNHLNRDIISTAESSQYAYLQTSLDVT